VPDEPGPNAVASFTPLRESTGIITPSALHFERHHSGVPAIDAATHTLTIHGLVDRARSFTMADLKAMPAVSNVLFIECSGNSSSEWQGASAKDVQHADGLTSCSEWTGVPLASLLRMCGARAGARWVFTEGADACRLARSLPMSKAMGDALVAYAQNGAPLRPEQGFPLRLVVPGWEGICSVKWLRRVEVIDRPAMTFWETARYTDLMPDGKAREFTFVMDVKSVITRPSGGDTLRAAGPYEITGLAWSGHGAIARVDVTIDGGTTWSQAELEAPPVPLAHTRFRFRWNWDGKEARIASRAVDDTGAVQPSLPELIAARGEHSGYHNNAVQPWHVAPNGRVTNGLA
jgi:sulfane dehydrogenase subunit SoxC